MFCWGLSDSEYCIFNKKVEKEFYELFEKQYKKHLNCELNFVENWPEQLIKPLSCSLNKVFARWYSTLPTSFLQWVKTLPNCDVMALYDITMLPDILSD